MRRALDWMSAPRGPLGRLALAPLFVASALLVTLGLQHIAARVYFILFVPAVMFSAWLGGRAAGLLASGLTVFATVLLLPRTELADQLAWLIVAAITTFGTSALTDRRRRAEVQLQAQAHDEHSRRLVAETLSQTKTDLLLQVAHELRQPLSAMTTAVRLLETAESGGSRQRAMAVMGRQTEQLRRMVEDLLDASKISRRELQLHKSTVDLCEVAEDTLHGVAGEVAARRLDVTSSFPGCPVHVTADPTRLRQIISNLLGNAVKFTPEGGRITLAVEQKPSAVVIRVRDNGDGIAKDRLSMIFEMFNKGPGEGAGLGIGLAVVKGLAEMHGGSVEAVSDGPGRGSEFIVTLPAAERAAA